MTLSHHRGGAGEPLVLIHGIGSFWQVWSAVLPALEARREVVALDLPGFGGSPSLDRAPHPQALAAAVLDFLDGLGWDAPHVAGNSLGGWVALEMAKAGRTRSVCALSPAGWWNRRERAFSTVSLANGRRTAKLVAGRADQLTAGPVRRRATFGQMAAHPERIPADLAAASLRNLGASPGFEATLDAMGATHFTGARDVAGPVTIAWAEKDRLLLPRQAERARRALPQARHLTLAGCGHVPTWDDPAQVAEAILTS